MIVLTNRLIRIGNYMELHAIGLYTKHENTFFIDRPQGTGDNLFILFKTNAVVICNESRIKVSAGSFILFKKFSKQQYGADNEEYMNHYLHFDCEDEKIFERLKLITGYPAYIKNVEEIENIISLISRENIMKSPYHTENIDLFIQLLLRKLSENQTKTPLDKRSSIHSEVFTRLRSDLYSNPGKFKGIKDMADKLSLSKSHFQSVYKEMFEISCYEDMLTAKISFGKNFLKNSTLSVQEISLLCGYESDTCFMRCFKKREGITPSEYRKKYKYD